MEPKGFLRTMEAQIKELGKFWTHEIEPLKNMA